MVSHTFRRVPCSIPLRQLFSSGCVPLSSPIECAISFLSSPFSFPQLVEQASETPDHVHRRVLTRLKYERRESESYRKDGLWNRTTSGGRE